MDASNMSGDQEGQTAESLEDSSNSPKETETSEEGESGSTGTNDPLYVQKRLKQQSRAHKREMEALRSEMQSLREQGSVAASPPNYSQPSSAQSFGAQPAPVGVDEQIHRAVTAALGHKEATERQQQEAVSKQHVAKQYQALNKHLDDVSDKYDDFDETVRGDAPFTPAMRDAALILPKSGPGSAGEVLYKLGKNPEELHRVSKLHPLDQAGELMRLSTALVSSGGESKRHAENPMNQMGNIKSNPITNSASINDKTSPAEIRARMKAGRFK